MPQEPFWPRRSPHFLACRRSIRPLTTPALIGLSGGPDSLALVAAAAAEGKDARCVIVDHGLQPGSREFAERAKEQSERLGVPADIVAVDVDVAPGESLEAAARRARYAALALAALDSATTERDIWVAHTADDQAETLLLGALRGNPAGMSGVGQVPALTAPAAPVASNEPRLVRPFLTIRRADTVGACAELGLSPWHDPMNGDPAYRRVAIRTSIIPALSELLGGDAVPALAKTAERIAADRATLEMLIDASPTPNCTTLTTDPPPVRQRRILAWLRAQNVAVSGPQLADIERLCTDWHGQGPVALAGGVRVARLNDELTILHPSTP